MERFKNINWHPALEDIVDNVFINDERMERESAMYRILTGNFMDPFKDIEDEYAEVDLDMIKKFGGDIDVIEDEIQIVKEEKKKNNTKNVKQRTQKNENDAENKAESTMQYEEDREKIYVPGIRKLPYYFPRQSYLDRNQQALCQSVLLRFSRNQEEKLSAQEKCNLESYMVLQDIILKEQNEFLEFAKKKWDDGNLTVMCNEFITSKLETKMHMFQQLPRYYINYKDIPMTLDKNVKIQFVSCLKQDVFPKLFLPHFREPFMLRTNDAILLKRYQSCIASNKTMQQHKLPVSEDTCCEIFANNTKADLVISSSGLKCILNNVGPDYLNSWMIPVLVKSQHGKNVIYIEKKLPPTVVTIPQKNTWVYKYILRNCLVDDGSERFRSRRKKNNESTTANTFVNSCKEYNELSNDHLKMYEEDLCKPESDSGNLSANSETCIKEQNVTYRLFTIGSECSEQNELMKNTMKEYRILVRTKTDGVEVLPNEETRHVILAPKMEHQLGFGAEAITLEEGMQQWASLMFRPDTSLARVRITEDSSEIIQIERHTTISLSDEIKRLYKVKAHDSLKILYNIVEKLSSLVPGRYILRHTVKNGSFITVSKQTENLQKNVFDLHTVCRSEVFQTLPNTQWPPIDTMVLTPALRFFKRMPAMFKPPLIAKSKAEFSGRQKSFEKQGSTQRSRGRKKRKK